MSQPEIKDIFGNYKVTNVKLFETRRGVAYTSTIRNSNKKVAIVENSGQGGCDTIDVLDNDEYKKLEDHVFSLTS